MKFTKPALTIPEQIAKLKARSLLIEDDAEAEHYLRFIGYYRLSAYALPLQQSAVPGKPFKSGTTFRNILDLYRFDRELRLLTMDAIERIEVAVRTVIVNEMAVKHGPHWFMDTVHFDASARNPRHTELLDRLDAEFTIPRGGTRPHRRHHEVFINYYFDTYTSPYLPPIWMISETLTLGMWSKIFDNLKLPAERKAIAANFSIDEQILRNWLHALTYLRNLCAHHARVWNRQMVIKPIIAKKHLSFLKSNDRFYAIAVVIHELMLRIAPLSHWHERLARLLEQHLFVDLKALGFSTNWKDEAFWGLIADSSAPSPATS
ncbi:MAG: Abi family protein [Verrucomicrobiaceae bacterium]|nr:Abi family protein [Verrucomicrobiaceae bacterium]